MPDTGLDAALLQAHAASDTPLLSRLYTEAADRAEAEGKTDAACFYLTHAYVFALEAGLMRGLSFEKRKIGKPCAAIQQICYSLSICNKGVIITANVKIEEFELLVNSVI